MNKPFEVIKNKWNSLSDGVYIAEIKCGSAHVALIQRISNGNYGAVYCFDYTASNLTPGLLKKFVNSWAEETLITNTDLTARFNPIEINGTKGDTFKNVLKNKCNNSVNFIVFNGSTENPISDNPFTSKNGYCIAFNSDRLNAYNYFILLGITKDIIETKIFDARS